MNIFEKASRIKLRFNSSRGELTVENLWDLPLNSAKGVSLNSIAREVYGEIQKEDNLDFVNETPSTSSNNRLNLQLDLVKHIIAVKKEERLLASQQEEKRSQINFLQDALVQKEQEEILGMSKEEIQKRLKEIQN